MDLVVRGSGVLFKMEALYKIIFILLTDLSHLHHILFLLEVVQSEFNMQLVIHMCNQRIHLYIIYINICITINSRDIFIDQKSLF